MAKLDNKKILIVEDDGLLSGMLSRKLIEEKAIVEHAIDGETASSMIALNNYDLILLDILIPKKNGFEVLESAQSDEKTKSTPIIILSNTGQKADVEKGIKMGAKKFLIKALFSIEEIIDASVEVLQNK